MKREEEIFLQKKKEKHKMEFFQSFEWNLKEKDKKIAFVIHEQILRKTKEDDQWN